MSENTRPQTWQIVNEEPIEVLETKSRESLDNLLDILGTKVDFPFRVTLEGKDLTVHTSEFVTKRSDGSEWGGTENSFRVATSPIQGIYKKFEDSTISLDSGIVASGGSFSEGISVSCPNLLEGQYVYLGFQATSNGSINASWGNPNIDLHLATYPTFANGTAICLIKLKSLSNTTGWGDFDTVLPEDIIIFKGSGGGGTAGGTDFVPLYKSSYEYRFLSTQGRQVRFNEKYFAIAEDLDFSYGTVDGRYYICLDTNKTHGIINNTNKNTYFLTTQLDPNDANFPVNLVALGWFTIVGGVVSQDNLGSYSTREVDTVPQNTHFVPYFVNSNTFGFNTTQGRFTLINGRYYGLDHDVFLPFDVSSDGQHYICIDTSVLDETDHPASGLIPCPGKSDSDFFVITTVAPGTNGFNPHYATLGQYNVVSGVVQPESFQGYSSREIISWVYGLPNVKRRSTTVYSFGPGSFDHLLNAIPNTISYHYWNSANARFEELDRSNVETSFDKNKVNFTLPSTPTLPWNSEDYVIIEAIYYSYTEEGGFASPKTDYTTGWFNSKLQLEAETPIQHPLVDRPKNITLEFQDTVKNIFWVEDGNQYVDKNVGGMQGHQVSFDWTSLPELSNNLMLRITMNLSKVSAGSFTAGKLEKGVVATTGNTSTAITPDIILKASDTNFGNIINQSGTGNIRVLVAESISVSEQQEINVPNVSFDMLPGTYIQNGGHSLSSVVKLSGDGFEVENIRIKASGDTGDGLEINARGVVKNCLIVHDGSLGGKIESALRVRLDPLTGDAFVGTFIGRTDCVNEGDVHYIVNEDSGIHYDGGVSPNEGDNRPKIVMSGIWSSGYRY